MTFVESGSKMNWHISANLHYVFLMENFEKELGEDLKDRQVGVSVVIDDNTGCQVVKVFFIGSPEVANTLKSIISFKSTEADNDFEITFKRSVIAYQDTQSDIAPCVSLHPNILSEIVNNHNLYKMKISIIQKCDDEAVFGRVQKDSSFPISCYPVNNCITCSQCCYAAESCLVAPANKLNTCGCQPCDTLKTYLKDFVTHL